MAYIQCIHTSIDTFYSIRILYMTDARASSGERAFSVKIKNNGA